VRFLGLRTEKSEINWEREIEAMIYGLNIHPHDEGTFFFQIILLRKHNLITIITHNDSLLHPKWIMAFFPLPL